MRQNKKRLYNGRVWVLFTICSFTRLPVGGWLDRQRLVRVVFDLWTEDEVVVGAGVAAPGGGCVILGVRVCVWASVLEGFGSGGCIISWTVGVGAEGSTVLVGGLAEALQVIDGAGGSPTLVPVDRVVDDVDGLDGGRQVVGVLHRPGTASAQEDPARATSSIAPIS